jgi:hypothetical protein
MIGSNRITSSIEEIRSRMSALDEDAAAKLDANMAIDFEEHFHYQELQARSHAAGKLSTDEALVIYRALGEVGSDANGGWASGVDTATKVACTLVISELMGLPR